MRAARIIAPRKFTVDNDPIPDCFDSHVRVKLLKVAICGSDLPYFSSVYSKESYPLPPGYPGHECLGVIEASRVKQFKEGTPVMYYPPFLDGFKEYHVTPPSRVQLIPDTLPLNELLITQLLGAVSHCAFRIDKPYNKHVAIMGQGPVGLLFTALMKNFGARSVIAIDPLDYRCKAAINMGATHTINPHTNDLLEAIKAITDGSMADIVIDAYGQDVAVINKCFEIARHNGQVAFFGICLEEAPRLNFNTFFRKELRMIASVGPDLTMDYPYALDMILKGAIDVTPLLTHDIPFEDIQKGFEMASNREDGAIKIVLSF
ncbi:MAG: zinc-binding dehydrogenase [Spirochaetes bacterium]|nr:zinc-binding dehydrogenase [Spirochaetota bacterium]MBP8988186.1 zinc-binding dehydrogenase [Spirochaetota bacterium]